MYTHTYYIHVYIHVTYIHVNSSYSTCVPPYKPICKSGTHVPIRKKTARVSDVFTARVLRQNYLSI